VPDRRLSEFLSRYFLKSWMELVNQFSIMLAKTNNLPGKKCIFLFYARVKDPERGEDIA